MFVGDLVDRGPDSPGVLRLVMGMVAAGTRCACRATTSTSCCASCAARNVQRHPRPAGDAGRSSTREPTRRSRARCEPFIDGLVSHYVLDGGRLVVAHAGLKEAYHGPGVGPGARRSRCTATPPARPTSTACRCATRGRDDYRGAADGRLRPHAHPEAGVGQQHDLPRHRLRVRRRAHRAALPVARAGRRCRPQRDYYEPVRPLVAGRRPARSDGPRPRRRRSAGGIVDDRRTAG